MRRLQGQAFVQTGAGVPQRFPEEALGQTPQDGQKLANLGGEQVVGHTDAGGHGHLEKGQGVVVKVAAGDAT
ncbi:hypothetical protein [Rahnella sp. CJA17(1/100)]|uniref:hypothetical protein n=1 Tax=Rahnella sp. CJA17(1/100) TaxID=2508951 RepID=UPI001430D095|nr:hypothetical protein [Rahnella sp. CJA17(1/100)]